MRDGDAIALVLTPPLVSHLFKGVCYGDCRVRQPLAKGAGAGKFDMRTETTAIRHAHTQILTNVCAFTSPLLSTRWRRIRKLSGCAFVTAQ